MVVAPLWSGEGYFTGLSHRWLCWAGNLTAVRYRNEILRPAAVSLVQQHSLIFQHDNARSQVARVCQQFLANHNIKPLDWLPFSPHLF